MSGRASSLVILALLLGVLSLAPFHKQPPLVTARPIVILDFSNKSISYFKRMCPGILEGNIERTSAFVADFDPGGLIWEMRRVNWCINRYAELQRLGTNFNIEDDGRADQYLG